MIINRNFSSQLCRSFVCLSLWSRYLQFAGCLIICSSYTLITTTRWHHRIMYNTCIWASIGWPCRMQWLIQSSIIGWMAGNIPNSFQFVTLTVTHCIHLPFLPLAPSMSRCVITNQHDLTLYLNADYSYNQISCLFPRDHLLLLPEMLEFGWQGWQTARDFAAEE